jgi:hypothetical protein
MVQEAEEIKQQVTLGGIDVVIANIHLTADPEAREGYTLVMLECPRSSTPLYPDEW